VLTQALETMQKCATEQQGLSLLRRMIASRSYSDLAQARLLNLAGILDDSPGKEDRFRAAMTADPTWAVPYYNLAVLLRKPEAKWQEVVDLLKKAIDLKTLSAECLRLAKHNLALAYVALNNVTEAKRLWTETGLLSQRRDKGVALMDVPLSGNRYTREKVWVQWMDPVRARVLSVVRYDGPCQFGDVVLCDEVYNNKFFTGMPWTSDEDPPAVFRYLQCLEPANYTMYKVYGGAVSAGVAMQVTEEFREAGLHIEVWSVTMRVPEEPALNPDETLSLQGGLVIHSPTVESAAHAAAVLTSIAAKIGVPLWSPDLLASTGDELGAARHRKALRQMGIG